MVEYWATKFVLGCITLAALWLVYRNARKDMTATTERLIAELKAMAERPLALPPSPVYSDELADADAAELAEPAPVAPAPAH